MLTRTLKINENCSSILPAIRFLSDKEGHSKSQQINPELDQLLISKSRLDRIEITSH